MRAFVLSGFLSAAIAGLLAWPSAASAQSAPPPQISTLSLNGEGTAEARPDMAIVLLGVTAQARTAKEAIAENSRLIAAVVAAAREAGIESRDLQTARVSLTPQYSNPPPASREPRRIVGYDAGNALTIRVRDLDKLGNLLDRLVVAGATDIRGVSLNVAKPEPLLDEARAAAIKDALRKAELYAAAGNLRIVRIVEIVEAGASAPVAQVRAYRAAPAAAPRPEVPIEAGEQTFRASVNVVFEIAPK
jgi:uncharacterized protein YggE